MFSKGICVAREEGLEEGLFLSGDGQHLESSAPNGSATPQQHWRWQGAILKVDLQLEVALVLDLLETPLQSQLTLNAPPHELLIDSYLSLGHQHS